MKFGDIPVAEAAGAILAHGTRHAGGMFKKGRVLSPEDVALLEAAGVASIVAARLAPDDVPEDQAARAVSLAACGAGARAQEPFTGRANLYSTEHGVLIVDEARVRAVNHLHESLTLATLTSHAVVKPRQMLATFKVIPFAVPQDVLAQALSLIGNEPLMRVAAFTPRRAGLVITRLPQTKQSIIEKSESVMRERLQGLGSNLAHIITCGHVQMEVSQAISQLKQRGCDPVLVMGASAIVDRADIVPQGLVSAGGEVLHLGMPVDPGNLLMLGRLGETPVVGVPSCARSPKVNGFDWVLERLVAGVPVTPEDIMDMGTGGLLAEIPTRPSPREARAIVPEAPKVSAIVLAAGQSSRMGANKLLLEFHGRPLISATLEKIRQSSVDEVVVVTGRDGPEVARLATAAGGIPVHNPEYATGIASSIRAGIAKVRDADAVIICLGDMPVVSARTIDRLIAAYNPVEHRSIVVPVLGGQFGNPVLWGAEHFGRLMALEGDKGARFLLADLDSGAVEIAVDDPGVLADADTPEALDQLLAMAAT